MRLSRFFLPILKENPKEAEIVSHRLMLRAGMMRQEAAGIYAWLPLGFRVLKKIEQIVREELEPLTATGRVAEVRGRGAMVAVELVDADGNPDAALTGSVVAACLAQGVLVLSCGMDGNVIRLLPPLVINEELLREGLGVLADALTDCA